MKSIISAMTLVLSLVGTSACAQSTQASSPSQTLAVETQQVHLLDEGRYIGLPVKATWNDDGRNMTLLASLSYVDPAGIHWDAPIGLVTDGASIPKFAWSIVGGPFEGLYRNAAVVHDAACDNRKRSWEATHEMFYHAMLTSKVDPVKAKIMYAAVYFRGPRWDLTVSTLVDTEADTNSIATGLQDAVQASNSIPEINAEIIHFAGPDKKRVTVHFKAPVSNLTQQQFLSLKKKIETEEAMSPGSVSLEMIRNYRPATTSR